MSEQHQPETDLREEFRKLGESLKQFFNAAWESEERQRIQQEVKDGMQEIGRVLDDFAEEVRTSDVGETIRKEANEFGERVRSGEVEEKTRQAISDALQTLNDELQKASDRFSGTVDVETEDPSEKS